MPHKNDGHFAQQLQFSHPQYLYQALYDHPFIMAHSPFALFVVSDKITVDVRFQARFSLQCTWSGAALTLATNPQILNRVLADEASFGVYLLVPVEEPDLFNPYSAIPRRQYNSAGKKLPHAEYPPPVSADLLTPAKNPFIGATLESCGAYLRASASASTSWDTEIFAVLGEQYITHGEILIAHSFVISDDERYAPLPMRCFRNGVQAYPCEKGTVCGHMALRTGLDFQEDLERYQRISKSRGTEDRSVGIAWELFQDTRV